MKKKYFILLLFLVLTSNAIAGSVGISPAYVIKHFEPGMETSFNFIVSNADPTGGIGIVLEGDLAKYANLSKDFIIGSGLVTVNLKFPEKLNKPGTHNIYVKAFESKNISGITGVGGVAAIMAPIRILVPYPGKYTESIFTINNVNEGENARYKLNIENLGTEDVIIDTQIEIFKINKDGEKLITHKLDDIKLKSKNRLRIVEELDTNNFAAGNYFAKAIINYGKIDTLTSTFKVGKFLVDIIDYNYLFEKDKINQFNIQIENKWNTKIENIYGEVTITDKGKIVSTFRTVSLDTAPWEIKNITGFFDTENLDSKRYLANMNLFYGNSSTHKLVAIYIEEPPKERNYLQYALIGVAILSLIMTIGFTILIIKIKKLKRITKSNAKKK